VSTILGDYTKDLFEPKRAKAFLKRKLDGRMLDLIALHHALYYCRECDWNNFFDILYRNLLAPRGTIHAVMMAPDIRNRQTTSWLYNHFAGKFFGCHNDQDLLRFKRELIKNPTFRRSQILAKTSHVHFFIDDFAKFMAVIWMIMLYPNVHKYNRKQKEEITEFVYKNFWKKGKPLLQVQHNLMIYKGLTSRGIA